MTKLPVNIDCGENFGRYQLFDENPIGEIATLANVACGFHGGDYNSVLNTLKFLKERAIKVGAHPSFPDFQGFGRRYMQMEFDDLVACIHYQIASLNGLCMSMEITMHHVKAHGALYNACSQNEREARALVRAVKNVSSELYVLTPPGSVLQEICNVENLPIYTESFADRAYNPDLSLVSRNETNAVLLDPLQVKNQYEQLCSGKVTDREDKIHDFISDTICIHGDHPKLAEIACLLK